VPPLAVIGNLAIDHVGGETRVGGGPFHAATGLRLLETEAAVVAKAGDPAMAEQLAALGSPVSFRRSETTAGFSFYYEGDTRHMTVEGLGEPWSPEEARGWVADAIGDAQWVHVAPLSRSDFPAETLAELARGRRILLDGQGLVRAAQLGPLREDDAYDRDVLRHVTVLKLAENEAEIVLPDLDDDTVHALGVPEVLLTLGSRGSVDYANGTVERVVARPVDADATGAGDAYSATYVASRAAGLAPVAAAERASRLVESLLSLRT
jgi:sugar/nucleoside kinase (ribokinase family)